MRPPRCSSGGRDAGFTLVEMLLAVAILGIGVLTVVSGMATSIKVSDMGRRNAEAQGLIRAYAEAVAADAYAGCATSYPAGGFTSPSGWSTTMTVTYWKASTNTFDPTCGTDSGLQRVTLTVTSDDGRAEATVRLGKRSP